MGQKQTTTTEMAGPGGLEAGLMQLLAQIAKQSGGQLGDLSKLAAGQVGGPTQGDTELVQQSIGRTGEMARRELERSLGPMLAQLGETNTARGIQGSSMEILNQILGGQQLQGRVADMLTASQQQGGQALLNLPFQRADVQLGANQTLFNMLAGAGNPVLQSMLQTRMGNTKTTTESPFNPMDIFNSAASIGGMPMFSNLFGKKQTS